MSISVLGGIIFVAVFTGMILAHELGHFLMARAMGIEVEEFGIFLPPRLVRIWRGRGRLTIDSQPMIIPANYRFPFDRESVLNQSVAVTAEDQHGRLFLRTVSLADAEAHIAGSDVAAALPRKDDLLLKGTLTSLRLGTEITLNWLPIGGFNRVSGEDDPTQKGGLAAANPWKRIAFLVAGPAMNLLTAVVAYSILFIHVGLPDRSKAQIAVVSAGSPAAQIGLQVNDIILSAGNQPIHSTDKVISIVYQNLGRPLELTILRNGKTFTFTATPRTKPPAGQGPLGVSLVNPIYPASSWFSALPISFEYTGMDIDSLLSLPGQILAGTVSPQEAQIGGPRSIWNLFQAAVAADVASRQASSSGAKTQPTYYTLLSIIALSISLGTLNLLPIPALDGGRVLFTLPEIIIRKRIPARFQASVNAVAFVLLMAVLAFFYIKDFINPIPIVLP
jgi:regulator of sigma E protease